MREIISWAARYQRQGCRGNLLPQKLEGKWTVKNMVWSKLEQDILFALLCEWETFSSRARYQTYPLTTSQSYRWT